MARSPIYNPIVLTKKTLYLQRIQEAVAAGYSHYVLGTVSLERAPALVAKFRERYHVHLDKSTRHRRKTSGLGNARLVLYLADALDVDFTLLVSPGEHAAYVLEKLSDSTRAPLRYREYELVTLTLKGRHRPGLTWRLDTSTVFAWRERLRLATAHHDSKALYQSWFSLYRTPGFAGIRKQIGELVAFWRREWHKLRGDAPCPICYPHDEPRFRQLPGVHRREDGFYWTTKGFPSVRQLPTLFYVRKQADFGEKLSLLLKSVEERNVRPDAPSA